MCGILAIVGARGQVPNVDCALSLLSHRGPNAAGVWVSPSGTCALGHRRLSIIDLSDAGRQPMRSPDGRFHIVFNGEIYNYIELRDQLGGACAFKTRTDTEVLLAAYIHWGEDCLERLIGMFSFAIWDEQRRELFAARDRFGVKPLYYASPREAELALASEIKALHALGIPREPDPVAWATYLSYGLYDHQQRTFWRGIHALAPGHALRWVGGTTRIWQWYDIADRISHAYDSRPEGEVMEEYRALLEESVRLRFRSDVPVGINLSGGVDSSILLGLVHAFQGPDSAVNAFTFFTGDDRYDELPWVEQMLHRTHHPHHACLLRPEEVPELAKKVLWHQDEPFGGLPTLAYSKVFQRARELGIIVLLDGQGLDEQWAGYDYYAQALEDPQAPTRPTAAPVQGSRTPSVRPECLVSDFSRLAEPFTPPAPFPDSLRNLQYRDARYTKIPRALRFNDRISMMHSTELREPFLDHRLFEIALRQPPDRKIRNGVSKRLLRQIAGDLVPARVVEAPKRPLQTPQREWLRGPLNEWAHDLIKQALIHYGGVWLDEDAVWREWARYQRGQSDNSFYIWQWITLGLLATFSQS